MSSLSPSYTLPQARGSIAATNAQGSIFIVVLLIVAAALSALRKDVTQGFDEVAHASYIAHIQHTGQGWGRGWDLVRPPLTEMRMLEPERFTFTGQPNYLNHPAPYYVLLAALGPKLEGHPEAIVVHRLINIAFAVLGIAALLMIGIEARLAPPVFYAYAVPIACIPVLIPLAGAVNNDNAAFAGGALTMLGAWQLIATGRARWLVLALAGVVIASWAKLTGLMLAGGLLGGVLLWLAWRGRFHTRWLAPLALVAAFASAPYIALLVQYGSPAPNTPGQLALLTDGAKLAGWDSATRLSPLAYAAHFIGCFTLEWMPILAPRNALNLGVLAIPIIAGLCAVAGVVLSLRRIARQTETARDVIVAAGALAFAATFIIHIGFSYRRHLDYGWMMDAYPRYYLPLIAIVPLAGLSLLDAIAQPRRHLLVGFYVAGPILFRLLAGPLQ